MARFALIALVLLLTLSFSTPAVAHQSGPTERQYRAVKQKLKKAEKTRARADRRLDVLDRQLDATQVRLDEAREALTGPIQQQVTALAQSGNMTTVIAAVFEPLRALWPCGSYMSQGEYSVSLDLHRSDTDWSGDEPVTITCL
jgi:septal ring factor EnvC (AmiA/AmiB activator)